MLQKSVVIGRSLGRLAGVALVPLGIACLPSTSAGSRRSAVQGFLLYNVGVAILLAWVGVATTLRGVLLWPAVVLHAVIAAALLAGSSSHIKTIGLAKSGEEHAGKVLD